MTLVALLAWQHDIFMRNKKGIIFVSYVICFLLYLVTGGIFFMLIEGPKIEKFQRDVLDVKTEVLQKFPNTAGEALDYYLRRLKEVGVRGLPDPNGTIIKLTFADAVFFSVTLLTTIGYGHVSPKSIWGKLFCILYTGFGIPMTLLLLASYVDRLMQMSESYKAELFRKLQAKLRPFYIRFVHIASVMALIFLLCFIIPAIIFAHYEKGWGIFDGIYFCFISLTTVGLGDLVPALDPEMPYVEVYKYGAAFFMIGGVTMMMFMMALAADFQQNYNGFYESLPYTIKSEKNSINPNNVASYGSIITQSGKSEEENIERIIHPELII